MTLQSNGLAIGKQKSVEAFCKKTPYSNTGVPLPSLNVRPDNLWLVFPAEHMPRNIELRNSSGLLFSAPDWGNFSVRIIRTICRRLKGHGLTISDKPERGKNFYEKAYYLRRNGAELAALYFGGKHQKGTFLFVLSGKFCSYLLPRDWRFIRKCAARFSGRVSRFDIAIDDYIGNVFELAEIESIMRNDPKWFVPIYRQGGYVPGFTKLEDNGEVTLYVGSKDSTVQVCAYEKGKESKDTARAKQYPNWIRYEVRFKRKKSELDLAMLEPANWISAAVGTSTYLTSKLKGMGNKFTMKSEDIHKDALESFVKAILAARNQYGAYFRQGYHVLGPEALLEIIMRQGETDAMGITPYDANEILRLVDSAIRPTEAQPATVAESFIEDYPNF